jgi:NADPH-dependent 2,4-dienoyl-CoA reductase/sulfur reductase-like enzyme
VLDDQRRIPADVVLMATGTEPNVEWLRSNGLRTEGGLLCTDTLFAVGNRFVVGAGDAISSPHPVLGPEPIRVEHWAATRDQAALAVENLLAGPGSAWRQAALPEFGTTIHGARIRCVGFPQVADDSRELWGSLDSGRAVLELTRREQAVGLISVNATSELDRIAVALWPGNLPERIRRWAKSPTAG